MLFSNFNALLQALSLTQGLFKPVPSLLNAAHGIAAPLLDATHEIAKPVLDVTKGVTTPLVGATKEITTPLLGAVKEISSPLLGAVHDIAGPLLEPVKDIADPLLDLVNESTTLIGLPLTNLPLLDILQSSGESSADAQDAGVQAPDMDNAASGGVATPPTILAKVNAAQAQDADSSTCHVLSYDAPPEEVTFAPFDSVKANIFRYRQQQSVNLGSWFVHENWMTPSLYTCAAGKRASELDIATGWSSPENARAVLERHWDAWITKSDLEYLAGIGINTVRLPIGYWSLGPDFLDGTDFAGVAAVYRDSWWRVRRAISWAAENDIGVLVDLHGAPGSQNGQSHSGVSTGKTGLFNSEDNMSKTINVLTYLTQQFGEVTNVVGIQILNEPDNVPGLPAFYDRAITAMRASSANGHNLPIYIHDGFDLDRFSNYVANRPDFVVEDHHSYFVFTPQDAAEPARQHTVDIATDTDRSLALASGHQRRNLVIGEWSCALTAQSLQEEDAPDVARAAFCAGQEDVYRNETAGWHFWSYKMENADAGWSFREAVGKSLPSTFFSYGQAMPTSANGLLPLGSAKSVAGKREHRFDAVHQRRQAALDAQGTQGYTDGFASAKIFAAHDGSKLGFIDQYVDDSIKVLGPAVVPAGTEEKYRAGFMRGLREAEAIVRSAMY